MTEPEINNSNNTETSESNSPVQPTPESQPTSEVSPVVGSFTENIPQENKEEKIQEFFAPSAEEKMVKPKKIYRRKTAKIEPAAQPLNSKISIFSKPILISALAVSILALGGAAGLFFWKNKKLEAQKSKPELETLMEKIGLAVVLPEGETPTLATVSDKEKLKEQPFFTGAENGDKVLIFSQAQKIVLFRPSAGKVVEVASLAQNTQSEDQAVAREAESASESRVLGEETQKTDLAPAKVAVYNGTTIRGLAGKIKSELASTEGIESIKAENAKGTYAKTLVIDLSGERELLVSQIAEELKGEIGTLPESESRPEADILIIAGEDQK